MLLPWQLLIYHRTQQRIFADRKRAADTEILKARSQAQNCAGDERQVKLYWASIEYLNELSQAKFDSLIAAYQAARATFTDKLRAKILSTTKEFEDALVERIKTEFPVSRVPKKDQVDAASTIMRRKNEFERKLGSLRQTQIPAQPGLLSRLSNWRNWSRADKLTLIGILIGAVACIAAVLSIPGVLKFLHLESEQTEVVANKTSFSVKLLTFDEVPTEGTGGNKPAKEYLEHYGIHISEASAPVVILNENASYAGFSFAAPSSPNVLTQLNCTGPQTFTLSFDVPARKVQFRRARLLATAASGISHPAWHAIALDRQGTQVDQVGEELLRNIGVGNNASARQFTLEASEIAKVQFSSDGRLNGKQFAAFCAVLLDDLSITR